MSKQCRTWTFVFCSDSSVRFATSLLFDVALYNLAGLGYFYINFLKFPLLKIKIYIERQDWCKVFGDETFWKRILQPSHASEWRYPSMVHWLIRKDKCHSLVYQKCIWKYADSGSAGCGKVILQEFEKDECSMPLHCVQHSHQPLADRQATVPFWLQIYFLPPSRSNFRELPSVSAQPAHWHQHIIAHAVLDGLGENGCPYSRSIPYQSKRVVGLGEGILAAHSRPYSFLRGWQTTWRHFRYADKCLWRSWQSPSCQGRLQPADLVGLARITMNAFCWKEGVLSQDCFWDCPNVDFFWNGFRHQSRLWTLDATHRGS